MSIGERLRYLGTDRLTWWDIKVVVAEASRDSPIVRAMNPDSHLWGLEAQLLAELVDTAHWLQWTKTKGAQKKPAEGMPDPIPRPGVKPPEVKVYKYDVLPADEMLAWLGWDTPDE